MRGWFAASLLPWFLVAPAALAQSTDPWLLLPTSSEESAPWMEPTVDKARKELLRRGIDTWSPEAASDRFEENGSAPAPKVTANEIEQWVERSRSAVRNLARADYSAARRDLIEAQKLADDAAEELNREATRARQVLDTCLYMVRALIETGNQPTARQRARECRQLVPRVEPTKFRHTPEVASLLEAVDAEMLAEPAGRLRIESKPSGCPVRINGIEFGRTPLDMADLTAGQYRLQVECVRQRRGRVHRVDLGAADQVVVVDSEFDRVIRSRPVLHLRYESSSDEDKSRLKDSGRAVSNVPASAVLLLSSPEPDVLRLDLRSGTGQRTPASAWIQNTAQGPSRDDLGEALEALFRGASVDFTNERPTARTTWRAGQDVEVARVPSASADQARARQVDGRRQPKAKFITGLTLAAFGTAGLAAGFGLHAARGNAGDDFVANPTRPGPQQRWLNLRSGVIASAGVGSAALVAAMPLALPEQERPPWWAWLSGGVGLGAAGFAIATAATLPSEKIDPSMTCADVVNTKRCTNRGQKADRAILFGATAAPLLTVPLLYLLRRDSKISPSVDIGRGRAHVYLTGEF